jgi:hypothetical protein
LRDDYSGEKHCERDTDSGKEQYRPSSAIELKIVAEYRDREVGPNVVRR